MPILDPLWFQHDRTAIISRSWQWVCHEEKLTEPGSYATTEVAGSPVFIIRQKDNTLGAFYNVCKHQAMQLLNGDGKCRQIMCPYHGWTYDVEGHLINAPATEHLQEFNPGKSEHADHHFHGRVLNAYRKMIAQ
jgi:phenylpropionate dioxygenase-like ring-hydroxylating dioxygenase large terminal subunit